MKRTTIILILPFIIAAMIGCSGGDGPSTQVSISILPQEVTLIQGGQKIFQVVVSGLSDQRVTWSATGGEIDDNGLYQATEVGDFQVEATSKADPSKKAVATVNVLPLGSVDFADVTAWVGTVQWEVSGSWSSAGEGDLTYAHEISEDITREYRLEDDGYDALLQCDVWRRRLGSEVVVSGAIMDKSTCSRGNYGEIDWSGENTVVPNTSDKLSIDNVARTYTIELYEFDASPIPFTNYDSSGDPWETWDNFLLAEIQITDQSLPAIGTTLAGSKVEKRLFDPLIASPGADQPKELEVTITWNFVPAN